MSDLTATPRRQFMFDQLSQIEIAARAVRDAYDAVVKISNRQSPERHQAENALAGRMGVLDYWLDLGP